ncbi:MAG TPA: energy transducer TonB [Polyangiaceae bacterium]|nr:energy transducer TonB [Polyangiaceae bacterium]
MKEQGPMAERAQLAAVELEDQQESAEADALRIHLVESGEAVAPVPHLLHPPHHPSSREVAVLILLSALLHGGAAYGFYNQSSEPTPLYRSKVEIELARPATPPPRVTPPPPPPQRTPPPPPPKATSKPVAAPAPAPTPEAPAAPSAPPPVDTGSTAAAADDGNLTAGTGGLGVGTLGPVAKVAPPAPPAAPDPIVQAHEGANYSKNPRPAYPARAKREGWEGKVVVRVQVLANGRPGAMKVQQSSGRTALDEAALEAIKGWSFVPARQAGEAVAGWVTVPIVFRLQ